MSFNPFSGWGFSNDTVLIYDKTMNQEEVDKAIEKGLSDFDIKLEGQDLGGSGPIIQINCQRHRKWRYQHPKRPISEKCHI